MDLAQAPRVHVRPKSRWNPSAVDTSIAMAALASRGCYSPMAVIHDGNVIGLISSDSEGSWADFVPLSHAMWCGFSNYSDIQTAAKTGHKSRLYFRRDISGWSLNTSWGDAWPCAGTGIGSGGTYTGAANTARQLDNTSPGCLWLGQTTPAGGETRHLVGWGLSQPATSGVSTRQFILYDRVLTYEAHAISSSLVVFTNSLAAQRYISSPPDGLMITPTIQSTLAATASSVSILTFTNGSGTAGQQQITAIPQNWFTGGSAGSTTTPAEVACPMNSGDSRVYMPWVPLGGAHRGVQKLETVTSSVTVASGSICWVLHKPLATMWMPASNLTHVLELTRAMFTMERVFDTACLSFLLRQPDSNTAALQGYLDLVQK